MLKPLTSFRPTVNLIPFSGVQFLDLGFNIDAVPRVTRLFWEEEQPETRSEDGQVAVALRCPVQDAESDELIDPASGRAAPADEIYSVNTPRALEVFNGKWVPVPFFRVKGKDALGRPLYDAGPSNWARLRLVELPEREPDGTSHRVVLAFDTELEAPQFGRPYLVPSPRDSEEEQEFAFVPGETDNSWFLNEAWVDEWLDELLRELRHAQRRGRPVTKDELPHACEHWARYLTFLAVLAEAVPFPRIKLADTVSAETSYQPIQVDLVLDIGNSRTCGILVESSADERLDLNESYVLELRDLSRPERSSTLPFESRIEFARAELGRDPLSRRSGRSNGFYWPSPVRIGPEATELSGDAQGTEGLTGLSSPKRYLWDDRPLGQIWRFNTSRGDGRGTEPPVSGALMAHVTESGNVLRQLGRGERERSGSALRPKFSRSSLFTLLLGEILLQALVQINAPGTRGQRKHSDVPRQLRRIILTMPPGMPLAEQRTLRSRAQGAVKLTWDCLGWTEAGRRVPPEPRVEIPCDEATCTQLVYLYTEITRKLQGAGTDFFRIMGRYRQGDRDEPSLRVASIDIGGGTTDLMVTTYRLEGNRALCPAPEFRESFRIAGDDILRAVIVGHVLPSVVRHLEACAAADARALVTTLFGGNRAGMSEQERHLRKQFTGQVLVPIGLAMLHACEATGPFEEGRKETWGFERLFAAGPRPAPHILAYLADAAAAAGAVGFRVEDLAFDVDVDGLSRSVRGVMADMLGDLCEVVHALGCDVLLLSGRPSRLPAIQQLILARLPVPPNRVIPMHRFKVGSWYPFRDHQGRIEDPKTTAAVGAMLCGLAGGQIQNFLLRVDALQMRSTARFIGPMEDSGQILADNVLFADVDLDAHPAAEEEVRTLRLYAPMPIGYRQMPLERWPAMPLYYLSFSNPQGIARLRLPLSVGLRRAAADADDDEHKKEDFAVDSVEDADGSALRRTDVTLRLQTMLQEAGYWLDTGTLTEA